MNAMTPLNRYFLQRGKMSPTALAFTALGAAAVTVAAAFLIAHDNQLRGNALDVALTPFVNGAATRVDSTVVARLILESYQETRGIAAIWSGLYWGFSWLAAVLGALAGLILKFESVPMDEKRKKDVAAFLTLTASLLVTISTSGDFQRKWQANRIAAAEIEYVGYDFLKNVNKEPMVYIDKVSASLRQRHLSILGIDAKRVPDAAVTAASGVKAAAVAKN
jgi:hypothetical protein